MSSESASLLKTAATGVVLVPTISKVSEQVKPMVEALAPIAGTLLLKGG